MPVTPLERGDTMHSLPARTAFKGLRTARRPSASALCDGMAGGLESVLIPMEVG